MKVHSIEVEPQLARQKFLEYSRHVRKTLERIPSGHFRKAAKVRMAQDIALRDAYRELSRGRRVIDLSDVMFRAGLDWEHRPKLAVAPADADVCEFRWSSWSRPSFGQDYEHGNTRCHRRNIFLPQDTFGHFDKDLHPTRLTAKVPPIPPSLRPPELGLYHILFDTKWDQPPKDPILLRRLQGLYFAVVAVWDLTELERSILR